MPTWRSANASKSSASASHRSANASEKSAYASTRSARAVEKGLQYSKQSADASLRSARAVERSTKAVEKSARAVSNTAVAGGHMDHDGNYLGPPPGSKKQGEVERGRTGRRDESSRSSRGRGEGGNRMRQIEYEPLSRYLGAGSVAAGVPVRV